MSELNKRGVDIKEDAVKKWRQGNSFPRVGILNIVSDILHCSILDFYPTSENVYRNITIKEINKNPCTYTTALISAIQRVQEKEKL